MIFGFIVFMYKTNMSHLCLTCTQSRDASRFNKRDGILDTKKCKDCRNIEEQKRRKNDSVYAQKQADIRRASNLKRLYGLTIDKYTKMFEDQNYRCKICNREIGIGNGTADVDHCHISNKVRGVLCKNCNKALGLVGDDINTLKNAIVYLENNSAIPQVVKASSSTPRENQIEINAAIGVSNYGKTRSDEQKMKISIAKSESAKKKYMSAFEEKLRKWKSNPSGKAEKDWRFQVARKRRENTLPLECIQLINDITPEFVWPQGTSHSTDSRIQSPPTNHLASGTAPPLPQVSPQPQDTLQP